MTWVLGVAANGQYHVHRLNNRLINMVMIYHDKPFHIAYSLYRESTDHCCTGGCKCGALGTCLSMAEQRLSQCPTSFSLPETWPGHRQKMVLGDFLMYDYINSKLSSILACEIRCNTIYMAFIQSVLNNNGYDALLPRIHRLFYSLMP